MRIMTIEPIPIKIIDNHYTRSCIIKRMDGDILISQKELWFKFSNLITPPKDDDCDSYLLALIMDAMKEGRKISIKGSVSKELLSNLVEYQSVWHKWLPDTYKTVDIIVDNINDQEIPVFGAICAFSGGVDATFSVWRHSQQKHSYRSQKINACSIVHGFDIPLTDTQAFINSKNKAANTLKDININLLPIYTNYRNISKCSWEHAFATALVATLSNFKYIAGTCIIGSSHEYKHLRFPWGSSPLTDHLLSSNSFKVLHDGSSHTRTEKVNEITEWAIGINNLRVCWEGEHQDSTCGKCEKCLRTQANFLANGQLIPNCFPDIENIEARLQNILQKKMGPPFYEWKDILYYAKKNNIQAAWVNHIEKILHEDLSISKENLQKNNDFFQKVIYYGKKNTLVNTLFPLGSERRIRLRKLLKKNRG